MRLKRLTRDRLSVVGAGILAAFIAVALLAPWLAPPEDPCPSVIYYIFPDWFLQPILDDMACEPYKMPRDGYGAIPIPPSIEAWKSIPPDWRLHPMGTTENRYDIYYGVIWGTRNALFAGVLIVFSTFLIGLGYGAIAGYYGGWVDGIGMRILDFMFALPGFLMTLVFVSILGRGLDKIVFVFIALGWTGYARFIRGDVLSVRRREYVLASRALGAGDMRLIFRHVVPNMIYPALILASLDIGGIVLGMAALSFLGLGAGEDRAEWGQMISLARNRIVGAAGGGLTEFWYTVFFPGAAIFLFVLAWNLIGDGIRDVLDPRMQGGRKRG
jgi:peptide/nickel transport system permease protein